MVQCRRRWIAASIAAVLVATSLFATSAAAGAEVPIRPAATAGRSLDDATTKASAEARHTGKAVEVVAAKTATDVLKANPNGSLTLERSLVPTRKKVGASWQDLDATLVKTPDGRLAPRSINGQVSFSAGGDGPFATMTAGGGSLSFTVPWSLPAPTLDGATATYAAVRPGVDLVVTAGEQGGFSHVLVVHDAQAAADPALKALTIGTTATNLTVTADAHGNLTAKDRLGQAVFTAPTPMAWDSTSSGATARGPAARSSAQGAGIAAKQRPLAVQVRPGALTLTPAADLLAGKDTVFPVFLDPTWNKASWGASKSGYASVPASYPDSNKWNNSGDPDGNILQVGNSGSWKSRAMINFPIDVARLRGATIYSAVIDITNTYSWNCTAKQTYLYAPATKLTSGNATWTYWSGVTLGSLVASPSFAHGYNSSCPAAGSSFNAASGLSAAIAANRTTQTFLFKSPSESDGTNYKEFSAKTARLSVTYNRKPNTPSGLTTSPATSCTANPASVVGDSSVSLYAPVSDPDGMTLGVRFNLWKTSVPGTILKSTDPNVLTAASGTTSVLIADRNTLLNAAGGVVTQFSWRVQTWDGYLNSDWSATCSFRFDPTRTGRPTVTLPTSATIGQPATFTISKPASGATPASYLVQLNAAAPKTVTANATGGATVSLTPTRFTNTVTVISASAGGNIGDSAAETFNAQPSGTPQVDQDLSGDNVADFLTVGGGNLTSGLWMALGQSGTGPTVGNGQVLRTPVNLGVYGTGLNGDEKPNGFDGTQVIPGRFTGSGLQDVLVYFPGGASAGLGSVVNGNGDGSPLMANRSGFQATIDPASWSEDGLLPLQLANAYNSSGRGYAYPDLLGIAGNGAVGFHLAYYLNGNGVATYGPEVALPTLTPTGGTDWNTWTITTTQLASGQTAMYLWQKTTGKLYLWTDVRYDEITGAFTYASYVFPTWNTNADLKLQAADINVDGIADLWAFAPGRNLTSWYGADLLSGTGGIYANPVQQLLTGTNTWLLNDGQSGTVGTAANIIAPATTASGLPGATWVAGDLFSPSVRLDGTTNGLVSTAGPVVDTTADFSISLWVKPENTNGRIIGQDGASSSSFALYHDGFSNRWAFGLNRSDTAPAWDLAQSGLVPVRAGGWTHLTATYKRSSGRMMLYVNGDPQLSNVHTTVWQANGPMRIGGIKYQGVIDAPSMYKGQVANVEVWNQTLTPHQVAMLSGTPGYIVFPADNKSHGNSTWTAQRGTMTFNNGLLSIKQTGSGTATKTFGVANKVGAVLTMQGDGNLVIYPNAAKTPGTALWASNTHGRPGATAFFQNDGNLVVYDVDGTALWASGTHN